MATFLLLLSLTWDYFYFNDYIAPWFGGAPADKSIFTLLSSGSAAPFWYAMLFCNVIVPAFTLWSRKIRTSLPALFMIALFVNVGMYLERVIIVPITLGQNEFPFSWGVYHLQLPETLITIGAFSLVFFFYIIFTRIFPIIPTWEIYEGQVMQGLRKIGHALIPTRSESD
jgi:molybdopterin-containing oxidoreductase family membrane subunit